MDEYLKQFLEVALCPAEGQRRGQRFMNYLYLSRPSLYYRVAEDRPDLNAFYEDRDLWETVRFVTENWVRK